MNRKYSVLMKYSEHCFKVQTKLFFAPLYIFKPQQLCFHAVLDYCSSKNQFCSVSA